MTTQIDLARRSAWRTLCPTAQGCMWKTCRCANWPRHGTPLFVYSGAAILAAVAAYQRGLAGRDALVCYAVKANSIWPCCNCLQARAAALTSSRAVSWPACWP